jgi:putative flippase GtrA
MKTKLKEAFDITRFTKFCITGVSSFAVGFLVFNLLYIATGRLIFSVTISYILSVINGFVWNRHWTFKDRRKHTVWNQALRFVGFYCVGYCINLLVYTFFVSIVGGFQDDIDQPENFYKIVIQILQGHAPHYSLLVVNVAGILATGITIIWNYLTNFFWSFK